MGNALLHTRIRYTGKYFMFITFISVCESTCSILSKYPVLKLHGEKNLEFLLRTNSLTGTFYGSLWIFCYVVLWTISGEKVLEFLICLWLEIYRHKWDYSE